MHHLSDLLAHKRGEEKVLTNTERYMPLDAHCALNYKCELAISSYLHKELNKSNLNNNNNLVSSCSFHLGKLEKKNLFFQTSYGINQLAILE